MTTITDEEMFEAMKIVFLEKGYSEEDIKEMADIVMNFFGFDDSIVDNKLTAKDRDLFYILETEGLLKTASDETHIKKGKLWRIHYWILNKKRIKGLLEPEPEAEEEEKHSIYDDVTDEQWSKHS